MTIDTIRAIQKQIVVKLEVGEDISELTRQLAQERAKIAAQIEIGELKKIADERQMLRDKAEAVKVKVQKQGAAIDTFLKLRDKAVSQSQLLIETLKELDKMASAGWEREPGICYSGFNDIGQFAAAVNQVPAGYLPSDFGCPFLETVDGKESAVGKTRDAYGYSLAIHGILANLQKGISIFPLSPVEGFMAIDNNHETSPETFEVELNCLVCNHEKVKEINRTLQDGRPLRELETEFGVSRSTLGRHKNRCLNLGAVRMVD